MQERPVWAEIDLGAIAGNASALMSSLGAGVGLCAVVKADGYGHGAEAVSRAVLEAGAGYLGVAILDEAVRLRVAGIEAPILIFGYTPLSEAGTVAEAGVEQTVFSFEQAAALSAAGMRCGKPVRIHMKVDTGMGRLGVRPEEAGDFAVALSHLPGIALHGVFTHFADADSGNEDYTLVQLNRFRVALGEIAKRGVAIPLRHAGNSAGALCFPAAHFDMVRAGIMLYGHYPSPNSGRGVELKPAMSLKTRIVFLKRVPAGTALSYGCGHVTSGPALIGTLPLGYADGYSRRLSGLAEVVVRGVRVPVVGNICMDQCMVDVTGVEGAREGDEVVIFGEGGVSAEELAGWLGTISYEVLCMVRGRVPRKYI